MSEGKPLQIIKSVKDSFELDEMVLSQILENDEIKDKFVAVISIAGPYRKGKSFLLSFFLRYLNAMVCL